MIKFGVAGNSDSFYNEGLKTSIESAKWCGERGIDVFEYSFGRGIRISDSTATEIGNAFKENEVQLTVHAPYFTNFSNLDMDKIQTSIDYVIKCLDILDLFKADRVIVHPASQGKQIREDAVSKAIENLLILSQIVIEKNHTNKKICIETMGKVGQIGTLDEVIKFCNLAPFFYPCIDFGHINARERGVLKSTKDFENLFNKLLDKLPYDKVNNMHIHFSKIEYGAKGELRHLTFEDSVYGPNPNHLIEALIKLNISPLVICESRGTQAEDCIYMKNYYNLLKKEQNH